MPGAEGGPVSIPAERRLSLLQSLADELVGAKDVQDVCDKAIKSLSHIPGPRPYALLYLIEDEGRPGDQSLTLRLRSTYGLAPGHPAAPRNLPIDDTIWPVASVFNAGECRIIASPGLGEGGDGRAVMFPLTLSSNSYPRGMVIAGMVVKGAIVPGLAGFLGLVSNQIVANIVNAQAQDELQLRRRIELHQKSLLDELNHRVKNTLATVQALASQTLRSADATTRDIFLARLFALSSQLDLLTQENWEGSSLANIVSRTLAPYREDNRERFVIQGPSVQLDPKRGLALGMAFHYWPRTQRDTAPFRILTDA